MFTRYNVSPIAIALLAIYVVSFTLYKTKLISVATHRKVWNVLLLASFLLTGVFGMILAVRRDYALMFTFPVNLLFWHVEAGIVMTVVSVFHLAWHLKYYRDLLRSIRAQVRDPHARAESIHERAEGIHERKKGIHERTKTAGSHHRAAAGRTSIRPRSPGGERT